MKAKEKLRACVIFTVLFLGVCVIRHTAWMASWDEGMYDLVQKPAISTVWLMVWYGITLIGNGFFVYTIVVTLALLFLYRNHGLKGLGFILLLIALFLSVFYLKIYFALPRPESLAFFYQTPGSYSFPSGHAVNGVVLFYFAPIFGRAVLDKKRETPESIVLNTVKVLMISGIAFSRVFLGVHWFSDVVGGIFWGFAICDFSLFLLLKWFPLSE